MTDVLPMTGESHYQVLGLEPRATSEQIDKAYRFHLGLYAEETLATYSLLDADELRLARARVHEAFEVLSDPVRRYEYDVSQGFISAGALVLPFPTTTPPAAPSPVVAPEPLSAAPVRPPLRVLPDPVNGEALRRYREERGVSLRDIAAQSKIGVRFLEYIEADRYPLLPAPVYLRGFVQEYARAVGLDPRKTAESYMAGVPRQA